jgi:hypothetical protein
VNITKKEKNKPTSCYKGKRFLEFTSFFLLLLFVGLVVLLLHSYVVEFNVNNDSSKVSRMFLQNLSEVPTTQTSSTNLINKFVYLVIALSQQCVTHKNQQRQATANMSVSLCVLRCVYVRCCSAVGQSIDKEGKHNVGQRERPFCSAPASLPASLSNYHNSCCSSNSCTSKISSSSKITV